MTIEEMQAQLSALRTLRAKGVRSTSYDGRSVTFGSDAELASAISDLEGRIADATTPRRRLILTTSCKGL